MGQLAKELSERKQGIFHSQTENNHRGGDCKAVTVLRTGKKNDNKVKMPEEGEKNMISALVASHSDDRSFRENLKLQGSTQSLQVRKEKIDEELLPPPLPQRFVFTFITCILT